MRPFRKFLKSVLLKLKLKYQSLSFRQRKPRSKRNVNVNNRHAKKKVKEEWSKRDTEMMLATRQSYSQRARQRNTLYFETTEKAAARVGKWKRQEDLGERKRKRHSPPPKQVNFDTENLLQAVTNIKDGEKVRLFSVQKKFTP